MSKAWTIGEKNRVLKFFLRTMAALDGCAVQCEREGNCTLRSADVFPVVASLNFRRERSDDRKYVCASQAKGTGAEIVSGIVSGDAPVSL